MYRFDLFIYLFIYNRNSELGHFGLCVIYNETYKIPLIKVVEDQKVVEIFNYCIFNNITTLESNNYSKYGIYTNYCSNNLVDGYSQMSMLYLENFYVEIFYSTMLDLFYYFNCFIILDDTYEGITNELRKIIPSNNITYYINIEEFKKNYTHEKVFENYYRTSELIIYMPNHTSKETYKQRAFQEINLNPHRLNYAMQIYADEDIDIIQNKIDKSLKHLNNKCRCLS